MPELLIDYDKQAKAEIQDALDKVERGTKRVAMEASLAAAEEMLAAIKAAAPRDSGTLRAGLVLHAEKNRKRGKQVYDVWPTPRLNYHFQKQVIHPGPGRRKIAYYPASQNYGFHKPYSDEKIQGKFYMEHTMQSNGDKARETVLKAVEKHIDEAWGD